MTGNRNNPYAPHEPTPENYDIRIAADGSWWHEGARIGRIGLVKLFASVLKRDEDGNFWLVTPAERGRIAVEDAPFVAVEMQVEGSGQGRTLRFRTNLDEWVTAGPVHPIRTGTREGETRVYVTIRDSLEALLVRSVYYELANLALAETGPAGVWSDGIFFPIA